MSVLNQDELTFDSTFEFTGTPESVAEALTVAGETITVPVTDGSDIQQWCEAHGFGEDTELPRVAADQAALTVMLRGIILSNTVDDQSPQLSKDTYAHVIDRAQSLHGNVSPAWFVLDSVAMQFSQRVFDWIGELAAYVSEQDCTSEFLGGVYESVVEQEDRWELGQFQTPTALAEFVATVAVSDADDIVFSPGVGAGALTTAAVRRKYDKGADNVHSDVIACDVSHVSALLGSAAVLTAPGDGDPMIDVQDFFAMDPNDSPSVDVVVSNPPYTKHHQLPESMKQRVNDRVSSDADVDFSLLSPLYVYFTVHAAQFLDAGDRAVFLTPAEVLNTEYGTAWKQFMQDAFDVDAFVLFDPETNEAFPGVLTTTLVTVATRSCNDSRSGETPFIRVDDGIPQEAISRILTRGDGGGEPVSGSVDWGFVNRVNCSELDASGNWAALFTGVDPVIDDQLLPLRELVSVSRGIATGENSFFCLSDAELSNSSDETGESWRINTDFLTPVVRKATHAPHYEYRETDWETHRETGVESWLLYNTTDVNWDPAVFADHITPDQSSQTRLTTFEQPNTDTDTDTVSRTEQHLTRKERGVVSYLKHGMQISDPVHTSYVTSRRDPWYVVERQDPADILYTSMSRGRGRFVLNTAGARNLNNLHGLHVEAELSTREVKALLAYLNSEFADTLLKQSGRTLSSGLSKVEPGDLKDIPVIDPRSVDDRVVNDLATLFERLCAASRSPDTTEQRVREEITDTLASFLDM